jgi:hypothetical protein
MQQPLPSAPAAGVSDWLLVCWGYGSYMRDDESDQLIPTKDIGLACFFFHDKTQSKPFAH